METMPCCEWKSPERSESVNIVFDMVRDLMWKIRDVDGIDKQQSMAMQLFKFLGSSESLDAIAQKLVALAMSADQKQVAEDKQDAAAADSATGLESLYVSQY